jgi:hypothetical protein
MNKIKNHTGNIYLLPGLLLLILAGAGSVIPVLPTVPFILAASWCLAKSSPVLGNRMKESSFYKAVESRFSFRDGITCRDKIRILLPVLLMLFILYIATESLIARSVIAAAAIIKVIFFICIKSRK